MNFVTIISGLIGILFIILGIYYLFNNNAIWGLILILIGILWLIPVWQMIGLNKKKDELQTALSGRSFFVPVQ